MNRLKWISTLWTLAFLLVAFSPQAEARYAGANPHTQKPKEKFTVAEKKFLASIAQKAATIVGKNLKETQRQFDQIQNKGSQNEAILSAVKSAYMQYRTYFALSQYNYFSALNSDLPWAWREEGVPLVSDFSPHNLFYFPRQREEIFATHKEDLAFIKSQNKNCGYTKKSIAAHYEKQLAQIITLVPVVLEMKSVGATPTDQEVLDGYKSLLSHMENTNAQFSNYDPQEIEGLWTYQAVAQMLVEEDPTLESVYESLKIKIDPEGVEIFFGWIKNVFFSYNILFIGCTVAAVVTANPILAIGCALANTAMAGYNLYSDMQILQDKRTKWLSGINTLEDFKVAKVQIYTDMALLGFNVFATASVIKIARQSPLFNYDFHKQILQSNLRSEALRQHAKEHARAVLIDQTKDQARGQSAGVVVTAAPMFINSKEVDHLSQAAADIIMGFKNKQLFTFKNTANATCRTVSRLENP